MASQGLRPGQRGLRGVVQQLAAAGGVAGFVPHRPAPAADESPAVPRPLLHRCRGGRRLPGRRRGTAARFSTVIRPGPDRVVRRGRSDDRPGLVRPANTGRVDGTRARRRRRHRGVAAPQPRLAQPRQAGHQPGANRGDPRRDDRPMALPSGRHRAASQLARAGLRRCRLAKRPGAPGQGVQPDAGRTEHAASAWPKDVLFPHPFRLERGRPADPAAAFGGDR